MMPHSRWIHSHPLMPRQGLRGEKSPGGDSSEQPHLPQQRRCFAWSGVTRWNAPCLICRSRGAASVSRPDRFGLPYVRLKRSARLLLSTTPNPPEGSPSSTHRHFTTRPGAPRVKVNVPIISCCQRLASRCTIRAQIGSLWSIASLGVHGPGYWFTALPDRGPGKGHDGYDHDSGDCDCHSLAGVVPDAAARPAESQERTPLVPPFE